MQTDLTNTDKDQNCDQKNLKEVLINADLDSTVVSNSVYINNNYDECTSINTSIVDPTGGSEEDTDLETENVCKKRCWEISCTLCVMLALIGLIVLITNAKNIFN